jgi:hypothetical protein
MRMIGSIQLEDGGNTLNLKLERMSPRWIFDTFLYSTMLRLPVGTGGDGCTAACGTLSASG